jgi:hypothetical protein
MRIYLAILLPLLAVTVSTPAVASDVYVVQGRAIGTALNNCDSLNWLGDVVVHNRTSMAQTITLVGLSNGDVTPGEDRNLTIPAGRTISLNAQRNWFPLPTTTNLLWVDHLDVPDGLVLESRIEIGVVTSCAVEQPGAVNGKVSLPIFRALQPAGVPAIHVGTDLGRIDARNNVGVFNAGLTTANVHIELRQGCDEAILRTVDVTLGPNTTQQFAIGNTRTTCPLGGGTTKAWDTYVTVTSDQPAISFVSSVANSLNLVVPYAVSSGSQN